MTPGAVPQCIRALGRFVPREHAGGRMPQRVSRGAFTARGLPVPPDPRQWNSYQLSQGQGWEWTAAIDRHVARIGAELLGCGALVLVDLDVTGDGDGIADLATLTSSLGVAPDFTGAVIVASPGHGSHRPGRHLWFAADASMPVRFGALEGWPRIEIKGRGTCCGSPGYRVLAEPDGELATLPRWLARTAGPPVAVCNAPLHVTHGSVTARLEGIVAWLLEAHEGDGRNNCLYWAAVRAGEMVRAGEVERGVAEQALYLAAEANGHVTKHGASATRATICSGFRMAAAA